MGVRKNLPFTILYQDAWLAAVNKSAGITVTAERWDPSADRLDLLVEEALAKPAPAVPAMTGSAEPAPADPPQSPPRLWTVHRIDRDTSGLVVFARDEETHRFLSQAFEDRQVEKRYLAVVYGRPLWKETSCDLPLLPNGNKKHLTIIDKYRGKKSLTHFRFLGGVGNYSVVEALPKTGRTHQIRVHLSALGHPVVCDSLYGSDKPVFLSSFKPDRRGDPFDERPLLGRLGLHAAELVLPRPGAKTGGKGGTDGGQEEPLRLCAPLARDMAALIKQIEKRGGKFQACFGPNPVP
jgi:RluA family pseudouridine synthase